MEQGLESGINRKEKSSMEGFVGGLVWCRGIWICTTNPGFPGQAVEWQKRERGMTKLPVGNEKNVRRAFGSGRKHRFSLDFFFACRFTYRRQCRQFGLPGKSGRNIMQNQMRANGGFFEWTLRSLWWSLGWSQQLAIVFINQLLLSSRVAHTFLIDKKSMQKI